MEKQKIKKKYIFSSLPSSDPSYYRRRNFQSRTKTPVPAAYDDIISTGPRHGFIDDDDDDDDLAGKNGEGARTDAT